jgi:SAM-dependent methyltransferase
MSVSAHVMWHDVECGAYAADLPLWRELARAGGGPVLDVGAGTGRVAIRLAHAGHDVTAMDRDGELLQVLAERAEAAGLTIETVLGDATDFELPEWFALIAVPMQTLQLLPDSAARDGFYASARRALLPGGLVAAAIADALESFEDEASLPLPDMGEADGLQYLSQPVSVRAEDGALLIERIRQIVAPGGRRTTEDDVVRLARLTAADVTREAAAHGLSAEPARRIGATEEHVGSTVVMLRG